MAVETDRTNSMACVVGFLRLPCVFPQSQGLAEWEERDFSRRIVKDTETDLNSRRLRHGTIE